jgi:hypothetical protein
LDASDGEGFTDKFCSEGSSDARALFFEYPEDPVSCTVEGE